MHGERFSLRRRRHIGAQNRFALYARPTAILQNPRAQTRMSTRASHACAAVIIGLMATFWAAVPLGKAAAADVAPAEDIRDIRGPKGIFPPWLVPALLAGGALLAIGGYAAWRW